MIEPTNEEADLEGIAHIGQYIRDRVIPAHMTDDEAADELGIGRHALSDLLNGRTGLTRRLALSLNESFKADHHLLLDIQSQLTSRFEDAHGEGDRPGLYDPVACIIDGMQIELWARGEEARSRLGSLIRRLVLATGEESTRAYFRADEGLAPGRGRVESEAQTRWVPEGESVWELGTGDAPGDGAERGYARALGETKSGDRSRQSFVFMTAGRWADKDEWAGDKRKLGEWRDVRAYDRDDLEEWIERSAPVQVWLSEWLGTPVDGMRSLERCWEEWSGGVAPALPRSMFDSAIEAHAVEFRRLFTEMVGGFGRVSMSLDVAADSSGEALAFLSCLAEDDRFGYGTWGSRVVVFDSVERAGTFAGMSKSNIVVVVSSSEDVDEVLGKYWRRSNQFILACPRGLPESKLRLTIDRLGREDFRAVLRQMNIDDEQADGMYRRTAGSPTVLRRLLSTPDAGRTAAVALLGSWRATHEGDTEAVRMLARADDYESVESDASGPIERSEPATWSMRDVPMVRTGSGGFRRDEENAIVRFGVYSRLDRLLAVGDSISLDQLDDLFLLAKDMPTADYSPELRTGICETLAILAAHGDGILGKREPGLDRRVSQLVGNLLRSLDGEGQKALDDCLPDLAEAAPEEFLDLLETVWWPGESDASFDHSDHPGLLRALERLAWEPSYLPRVANVLAGLRHPEPSTRLETTPRDVLGAIFSPVAPQNGVSAERLNEIMESLTRSHPGAGWTLLVDYLSDRYDSAPGNERPRWRAYALGAGIEADPRERERAERKATRLALDWPEHDENTLCDLIGLAHWFTEGEREALWDLVEGWSDGSPSGTAREKVWNRLRLELEDDLGRLIKQVNRLSVDDQETLWSMFDGWKDRFSPEGTLSWQNVWDSLSVELRENRPHLVRQPNYLTSEMRDSLLLMFDGRWGSFPPTAAVGEELLAWLWTKLGDDMPDRPRVRKTVDRIAPEDSALRFGWLFRHDWQRITRETELSIEEMRTTALRETWDAGGISGLGPLIENGEYQAFRMGELIPRVLTEPGEMAAFVMDCVRRSTGDHDSNFAHCLRAALGDAESSDIRRFAEDVRSTLGEEGLFVLLMRAPMSGATLLLVDTMDVERQAAYWREIQPDSSELDAAEVNILVDRLIDADRPGEALRAVGTRWDEIETRRLMRLLDVAVAVLEGGSHWTGFPGHEATLAFEELNGRDDVATLEKAELELMYAFSLRGSDYGMPNLEIHIERHPAAFVELVRLAYGKGDSSETSSTEDAARKARQQAAKYALATVHRVPGARADGSVDGERLGSWLEDVFSQFDGNEREEQLMMSRATMTAGELLSAAPADPDGVWPCRAVCEVIERQDSQRPLLMMFWKFSDGAVRRLEDSGYGSQTIAGFKYNRRRELGRLCCENSKRVASEFPKMSEALKMIADRYEHKN